MIGAIAFATPYGRYGFEEWPKVDGFELTTTGIRAIEPVGDRIGFFGEMKDVKIKRLDWQDSLYQGRNIAYTPGAIRCNGFEPGFRLYFPLGLRLKFSTNMAPFLTWGEGTVDMDNPTAPSTWVLLSFRTSQAPILLTFDQPVQLITTGDSGDWTLTTVKPFKGWMRAMLPLGPKILGPTVGALGGVVKGLKPSLPYLSKLAPELSGFEYKEDDSGITAIWSFSGPGAMIPRPAMLAKVGGYSVSVLTGVSAAGIELTEGPVRWSTEPRIAIRFPARRLPSGRSLSVGDLPLSSISTVSAFDYGGVAELSMANLNSARENVLLEAIQSVEEEFVGQLKTISEPLTGRNTQIDAEGTYSDVVAGRALLYESVLSASGPHQSGSSSFFMLEDRFDWTNWRVWGIDLSRSLRSTGLMSLAGGISQVAKRRLLGAMAQTGISAAKGQVEYRRKRGFRPLTSGALPDPYVAIRASFYSVGEGKSIRMPFVESLMSPVRVLGPYRVTSEVAGSGYLMSWIHEGKLPKAVTLLSGFPIEVEAKENLSGIKPMGGLGLTQLVFEPESEAKCGVILRLPTWAGKLPPTISVPRYSE